MDKAALILAQAQRLAADFSLYPVLAAEIEFYLHGSDKADLAPFWEKVEERCAEKGVGIFKMEKERGFEQHEVALVPVAHPAKAAQDAETLKAIITATATEHGWRADFAAKPLADQPGSGLHIHVHLADREGINIFYKDDKNISEALLFSLGGLLAWLPDTMPIFAPTPESYARFAAAGDHTPTTVSWGANNRTVALRLPDKPKDQKHIEHRVAGADADPFMVVAAILAAIHYGIKNQIEPGEQMYGDAGLEMYHLPKLPLSLDDAQARMRASTVIAGFPGVDS